MSFIDVQSSGPDRDRRAVDVVGDATYSVQFGSGGIEVDGPCRATIDAVWPISLGRVKRGLHAEVDGLGSIELVRPRFGLRRADRSILIQGRQLRWRTIYRSVRRFEIVAEEGDVVMRRERAKDEVSSQLGPCEVALVLAVLRSEVIDTSSLVSYITF